jgi:hypothetical protein
MINAIKTVALALAAAGLLAAPAGAAREKLTGEAKLAKMLEGRVAGEPVSCISTFPGTDLTVIDGTALVYKRGNTLYVNRTAHPGDIDRRDTIVTRTYSARLCRQDIVTTYDLPVGFYTGNIFLEDFIPYRKPG